MSIILEELKSIRSILEQQCLTSKKVLSLKEAAIYLEFSESALYRLTSHRLIPHSKPNGKKVYFDRDELDKWMLSHKVKTIREIEEEADIYILKRKHR